MTSIREATKPQPPLEPASKPEAVPPSFTWGFVFAIALLLLVGSGCNRLFGDPGAKAKPFDLRNAGASCAKTLGADLASWWQGQGGDVGHSMDCIEGAIEKFTEKTRGARKDEWTHGEVAEFLGTNLSESSAQASSNAGVWVREAFLVKQIVFGGKPDSMSREELGQLKSLVSSMRPHLVSLSPRIRLLRLDGATAVPPGDGEKASKDVEALVGLLAQRVKASAGRPTLSFDELFTRAKKLGLETGVAETHRQLVEASKSILIGGEPGKVDSREWPKLVETMGLIWVLAVRAKFDVAGHSDPLGTGLGSLEQVVARGLDLVSVSIEAQGPSGGVPVEKIEALIEGLERSKVVLMGLTPSTVKGLIPIVLGKYLHERSRGSAEARAKVLDGAHLSTLRSLARDWFDGQREISRLFADKTELTAEEAARALARDQSIEAQASSSAATQLRELMLRGRPLVKDTEGRLSIVPKAQDRPFSKGDVDLLNVLRTGISRLLRSYPQDSEAAGKLSGLTEDETAEVYADLRAVGVDLGLLDVRGTSAGRRTFMEASLFTSVSDGNDRIDLKELIEWFNIVLSSGRVVTRLHASMVDECGLPKIDVFGRRVLDSECFRRRFDASFAETFAHLPELVKWRAGDASGNRAKELLRALETAGRPHGPSNDPIDSSDLRSMSPILHYAENLIVTWDKEVVDGTLSSTELWAAYPVLSLFIGKVAGVEEDWIKRAVFSWLLVFGEPPEKGRAGTAKLLAWSAARHAWSESADRLGVVNVMSGFVIAGRRARQAQVDEFYTANRATLHARLTKGDEALTVRLAELFQCQPSAVPILTEVMKSRIDDLVPRSAAPVDPAPFTRALKGLIRDEPRLERVCQPW